MDAQDQVLEDLPEPTLNQVSSTDWFSRAPRKIISDQAPVTRFGQTAEHRS